MSAPSQGLGALAGLTLTLASALASLSFVGCPQQPDMPTDAELAKGRIIVGQQGGGSAEAPDGGPSGPAAGGGYLYVARRGIVAVGLADEKRMGPKVAAEITRRTADVFEACITEQIPRGAPTQGAARAAVKLEDDGSVIGVAPSVGDVANASLVAVTLRCLKAPLALMTYPPADADAGTGERGFAVEVLWR